MSQAAFPDGQKPPPAQIPMGLVLPAAMGRADFFVTDANARALAVVECWERWPQGKLVLIGPEGAGKTHLAHLWASEAAATVMGAQSLAAYGLPALVALVTRSPRLAVEDIDRIAGAPEAEAALFHLHNLIAEAGGLLLLTARAAPARLALKLPDLASRMQAATVVALDPPDDRLLKAVLVKLFSDRQLLVHPQVIDYVLARMERSLAAAQRIVAALDRHALAARARVSVGLAADVLGQVRADAPGASQVDVAPGAG